MPNSAILLIDLQVDFLDCAKGRLPVDRVGSEEVIRITNGVLSRKILPDAVPVFIVNRFYPTSRIANFFRKNAALAGTHGANIDERILRPEAISVFEKSKSSAFSNPQVADYLNNVGSNNLYVLGVFAEGCISATVHDAIKLGFKVHVIENAVATNAPWKKQVAMWSMKRAGATLQRILI